MGWLFVIHVQPSSEWTRVLLSQTVEVRHLVSISQWKGGKINVSERGNSMLSQHQALQFLQKFVFLLDFVQLVQF
jgi:hypothetical protein